MKRGNELDRYDIPRSAWEQLINEWIFSERDREILRLRLLDGRTYEDIADAVDMSVCQVKRIVYKQSDRIFKHI